MKITLNDGSVQSGIYEVKNTILGYKIKPRIISATTKERYRLEEIQSIMMYTDTDSIPYEVIPVKKYMDSGRTEIKLAQVGYKGDQIELFYVSEIIYQGGPTGHFITTGAYCENYVKKTGDSLAYNMGYIYGAGQRGIKKRVREFFIDCPRLIEKVDKNEIPKKETLQITLFYENNCKTATSAN
jgi:hypothetical protein